MSVSSSSAQPVDDVDVEQEALALGVASTSTSGSFSTWPGALRGRARLELPEDVVVPSDRRSNWHRSGLASDAWLVMAGD